MTFGKMDDGRPAFPAVNSSGVGPQGMSLRDYFAAKCMAAIIIANDLPPGVARNEMPSLSAKAAYIFADMMLQARKDT